MLQSVVYPLLRPDLREALMRGYAILSDVMRSTSRRVNAGAVVIEEEETHELIYHVDSGWMARSRHLYDGARQLLVIFLPNDMIGVKGVFLATQADSIIALGDSTVSSVDRRTLLDLAAREPEVALYLMFHLSEVERRLQNWTVAMARPAVERIALMLLDFRGRLHRLNLLEGDIFEIPMTQEQIGERTGLSVVHVNRSLRALRERGIATMEKGVVRITDLAALRKLALPALDVFEREDPAFGADVR